MIEIRSRYSGEVLYTAKDARDVRVAVEKAAREGANLTDAYLTGADLTDANLRGANLRGADLRVADLIDANLTGAYLTDANLRGADLTDASLTDASLRGANLTGAYLTGADLTDANLRGASLRGANLRGANLTGADLTDASLRGANLTGAYLTGAKGFKPEFSDDLRILLDQVGKIRAYKLVTADLTSPIQSSGKLTYEIGSTVKAEASADEGADCGPGINIATLPWCLRNWRSGCRVLLVEFTRADIAAIPHGTDGKFRCHKVKVIREVDISGLVGERAMEGEGA